MRIWKKILLITLIVFSLFFVSLHIFVNIKGKRLLSKKLEETFNRKVNIGSLFTSLHLDIHIKNIQAEGLFKIEEIIAGGGIIDLLRRDFRLSLLKIIRPTVTIERDFTKSAAATSLGPQILSPLSPEKQQESGGNTSGQNLNPLAVSKNKFLSPRFSIGRFIVKDGILDFIDRGIDGDSNKSISIRVKEINIKINNLNLRPSPYQVTSFELEGKIPWGTGEEGKIEMNGWINLYKNNMEASVKIADINGVYLYPYYSKWVDLEKARIEKAKLNFTSNINGLDNNLTAECHLELTDIVFKPRPAEEQQEKAEKIATAVLDIFKALNQGKIVLDFTIRTKMNRPEFGFGNIRMAVEDKITQGSKGKKFDVTNVLLFPAKLLEGTVKGATEVSKAVIGGTFAVGNELKKAVEDSFRKEKKEENK